MNAEAFSLKARRTTRVPLRVPVQLSVDEGGVAKTLDGWTVIVNIHGAKIESKRRMQVGETVKVTVPLTRKTQTGEVVWSNVQPNSAGNYEFAVELSEPGNLWGVGFPPSDWKAVNASAGPVAVPIKIPAVSLPRDAFPPAMAVNDSPTQAPEMPVQKKIVVAGYQPQPIAPFTVNKVDAAGTTLNEPVAMVELAAKPTTEAVKMESPIEMQASLEIQPQAMESPLPEAIVLPAPFPAPELEVQLAEVALPEMPLIAELQSIAPSETIALEISPTNGEAAPAVVVDDELTQWINSRGGIAPVPEATSLQMDQLFSAAPEVCPQLTESGFDQEPQTIGVQITETAEIAIEEAPSAAMAEERLSEMPSAAKPIEVDATEFLKKQEESLARIAKTAESAFQAKVDDFAARAGENLQAKLGELEATVFEQIDQKLHSASEEYFERFDQQVDSIATSRRVELEQNLTKFAETLDTEARERQQESLSRAEQDLRRRANEISIYAQCQVQLNAKEAVEAAQSEMATKLQDLLPTVEQLKQEAVEAIQDAQEGFAAKLTAIAATKQQEVAEQSLLQAEHIHKLHRSQFEATLSSRIEDARAYWEGQLAEMQQATVQSVASSLSAYADQQSRALMQQTEGAMAQMAAQVQKTFFKHVIAELTNQQHQLMSQIQRDINNVAERGVHSVRKQMVQLLSAMGEALVGDEQQEGDPVNEGQAEGMVLEA